MSFGDYEDDEEDEDDEKDLDDSDYPDEDDIGDEESAETEPCPYCGKPIYERAEVCPHCGQYISKEDWRARKPVWIVVGAIICVALILLYWLR
jgi:predicted nucleic acid-binding Zn ribbon protein